MFPWPFSPLAGRSMIFAHSFSPFAFEMLYNLFIHISSVPLGYHPEFRLPQVSFCDNTSVITGSNLDLLNMSNDFELDCSLTIMKVILVFCPRDWDLYDAVPL
jgi:hypothetical protein